MNNEAPLTLSKADFEPHQGARWCPGCGDHSILSSIQKFLPSLGKTPEKYVFVSGIGCSSRFPYYMSTYGIHGTHGRAPTFASGIKLARPDLSVWVISGDGDALSIGGNHFIHLLRRNLDLNLVVFNNRIYGLTKGQYSPTSEFGKITKSSPAGSPDQPLIPALLALGAQATFVARVLDVDLPLMQEIWREAQAHKGTSFIEVYQNCVIFNDGAFDELRDRAAREERQLVLRHGQPMIFGKNKDKGLRIMNGQAEVISLEAGSPEAAIAAGVTLYDSSNLALATSLAQLTETPGLPIPMGVFYKVSRPTNEEVVYSQIRQAQEKQPLSGDADEVLKELFFKGDVWEVK